MKRVIAIVVLASCAADMPAAPECRRSSECDTALCVSGQCQSLPGPDLGAVDGTIDGARAVTTDSAPAARGPCVGATAASAETVALNEVLVNVPVGLDGDANGDGERDAYDDEFVELVNVGAGPIDLRGVRISSGDALKHTFDALCLLPMDSVVVFGGGSVGAVVMGNAVVAERRFAFGNEGGLVRVSDHGGAEIARLAYGSAPPASFTRTPQLSGVAWVNHLSLSAAPFSPGRCPDGAPIGTGCPASSDVGDAGTGSDAQNP